MKEPLQTGIKAIDSMIPIGRGQRELIIGDRGTGKTALIIDTILNQRGGDLICIYVAIGQKSSTVAQVVERLREAGAMEYTILVVAPAHEAALIKWMAPYAGTAMGEHFSSTGSTRPASTTTSPSTRTRTASFRCCCGGRPDARRSPATSSTSTRGCSSAVQARRRPRRRLADRDPDRRDPGGRRRCVHPDERDLDHGRPDLPRVRPLLLGRPPGDQRRHLSLRVGGSAQIKAMRSVAGRLRLDLSQYRELEAFSQFGSELDEATRAALNRGEKMVSTLNQPQHAPWPVEEQVVAIFAGTRGYLDDIPTDQVPRFQDELREFLRTEGSVLKEIRESGELSDELTKRIEEQIDKFKNSFNIQEEKSLVA